MDRFRQLTYGFRAGFRSANRHRDERVAVVGLVLGAAIAIAVLVANHL